MPLAALELACRNQTTKQRALQNLIILPPVTRKDRFLRTVLPSIVTVGYASIVALENGTGAGRVACVLLALVLAARVGRVEWQLGLPTWALGLSLVCALSPDRPLAIAVGLGAACLSLAIAGFEVASMTPTAGLAASSRNFRARPWLVGFGFAAPLAGLAVAVMLGENAPTPIVLAGLAELATMLVVLRVELVSRRLELGVPERIVAMTLVAVVTAAIAAVLVVTKSARAASVAAPGSGVIAFSVAHIARRGDSVMIGRLTRRAMVATAAGSAVALLVEMTLLDRPHDAGLVLLVGVGGGVLVGLLSAELARGLRPANGVWLDAMERAMADRLRAAPDEALRLTLVRLREAVGPRGASPELYLFHPSRCMTVDAAGYVREHNAPSCGMVTEVASREPEALLRTDVLERLEVRRPDLRPVLAWMRDRDALCAVVVTHEGEAEALLVLPRGDRTEPLALEEARALKTLADGLAGACHARAAIARSHEREKVHERRAEQLEETVQRLEHLGELDAEREARMTARLARPATVGLYSTSSRSAYEAIERRTRAGAPIVVFAKSGVDPVPYLARAHQAGVRSRGPLVLVDATQAREHDLDRWKHPSQSPLGLADRGLLVLLDGAVLPVEVQRLVAEALAEKRRPWPNARPLDVVLAVTSAWTRSRLQDALDPMLAARLGDALDHAVTLPSLAERAEDLRSLLVDRLAREGLRVRGRPVGIDDAAFALLVDHPFPGEDAELSVLAQRLVAACEGDVVRRDDICKLQLYAAREIERDRKTPKLRGV